MMVTNRPRRTREVTGPTPHSVAIFARPTNKRAPEQLILDRRKLDDQRQENEAMTKYNKICDLKNDWEKQTDRKIQINTVRRRVQGLLLANEASIEDRRERLRILLASEDDQYLQEMSDTQETTIERQAKMRERAKELKRKREAERMELVQDKLDQQWRNQCEELRSTMSKRQQDMVAAERMEQLRIKSAREKIDEDEDRMFAELWYADMKAKAEREEKDTQRQMSANRDMLETLNQQVAALEAKRNEEKLLRIEEAQLLEEQAALQRLEAQKLLEEKRRKQEETRSLYANSLRLKAQREAKELQEQLAFDMKMLEELLVKSRNEAKEQTQRKKELREEDRRYRDYLEQLRLIEAQREKEMEGLVQDEVEKMWTKRLHQWQLEKEARQQLMKEVLASRRLQLDEKLRRNETRIREAEQERVELIRKIEENRRMEEEKESRMHQKNKLHQGDLVGQMRYNSTQRGIFRQEEEREWHSQMDAEREYRIKLEEALEKPEIHKVHPVRRAIIARNSGQLSHGRSGGFAH